ncbi:MAG: transglycosylase domain-containing protein [Bacteroidia bacterium]|nr:transglycosylase domain-containing protein [Bacteroidia bacterium]
MQQLNLRDKRLITLVIKVTSVFLLVMVIIFFSLRGYLLNKAIEKVQTRLATNYATRLTVQQAGFSGLATVNLKGLEIIPEGKDTLFKASEFSLSIKFWYALIADIRVENINLDNGYLQLVKRGGLNNFDQFYKKQGDSNLVNVEPGEANEKTNYAKVVYKLIVSILNKVPNRVSVHSFALKGVDEDNYCNFNVQQLLFDQGKVNSVILVQSNELTQQWQLSGIANPSDRKADITFSRVDTGKVIIPYLLEKFHIKAGFNSVRMQLNNISFNKDELRIDGLASIQSFMVNHPKISKKDVIIDKAEFTYACKIGGNYISLDSSSAFVFNDVVLHPFIRFQNAPDTIYYLSVRTENTEAQKFISALPEGLFSHVKGMEASGKFTYRLDFVYNENKPDDMIFESVLIKDQFKIIKYGEANLAKLNGEFSYVPMENGHAMRAVIVGADNPNYTPLADISPYLKRAVLTTEDPSFYWHRGFVTEAFRQSIVKNIRTGKFKRGASTLSMQLVKNVFLTREKTMARKLEEILLVYILENNNLCSKDRMFEVYLNIIEWGPNVYGVGEASRFYFEKKPFDLTLSESLFLATIIPAPKHFMWRFNNEGNPKPYLERTYRFLSNLMIARNVILAEDTLGLTHEIQIKGAARKFIIKNDSLVNDTLIDKEFELIQHPDDMEE